MSYKNIVSTCHLALLKAVGKTIYMRNGDYLKVHGFRIRLPKAWVPYHTRARIFFNRYEKSESRYVKKYLDPNIDVVELGVGIGVITSAIVSRLKKGVKYLGVEANPELASLATENFTSSSGCSKVSIVNAMISSEPVCGSTDSFFVSTDNFHFSSASRPKNKHTQIEVVSTSLSRLLKNHNFGKYQLVADVEGAEYMILKKDSISLAQCTSVIIELHHTKEEGGESVDISNLVEMFLECGFNLRDRSENVFYFIRG